MGGRGSRARVAATIVAALFVVVGGLVPGTMAAAPDRSDVVLVLDFSGSILRDKTNRDRFAAALDRIADRVDATTADLIAGDSTVSIVQFASSAIDYPGCAELKLLGSPSTVKRFAECLRSVAGAYRKGVDPALTKTIGIDTNYVAAMEQAAKHLPADAVRPAMILLTDGKHDVKGVPVSQVQPALERLFGGRSPFALLPVGMGLDPAERDALATGLEQMRVTRDMPACASGAALQWPTVVFESPDEAGNAVAIALEDATCTFTAGLAPTPAPSRAPTVTNIQLTPGDGQIAMTWDPPAGSATTGADYRARCRAGDADPIESKDGASPETKATVVGLANGTAYVCEVALVRGSAEPEWTAATSSAMPIGRPTAPAKPAVEALNGALQVSLAPDAGPAASTFRIECSNDNGGTWPATAEIPATVGTAQVGGLTNGVDYVCRAFAANTSGVSDASPLSDAVRPCSSPLECNSQLVPIVGGLGVVLVGGILIALIALYRGRTHGHVVAVADVIHTANIGHGSSLGISFIVDPATREVTGIVADKGRRADVKIRRLRGARFRVTDRRGKSVIEDGEPILVTDSIGVRHRLVLQAFATNAASQVATRR
jgi:von Willebrand factor type A domain